MKPLIMRAAGAAPGMGTPVAERSADRVIFGFRDRRNQPYLVYGPVLTVEQAKALVTRRYRDFESTERSRESFEHKVIRKLIAAQGVGFASRLKAALNHELRMELEMMLSPDSHSSTVSREELDKIRSDRQAVQLVIDARGRIRGDVPDRLSDNSGHTFALQE